MAFYACHAPLYSRFSVMLLAATRAAISRMLLAEAANSEEGRRRALAYLASLQAAGSVADGSSGKGAEDLAPIGVLLQQFSGGKVR